MAIILATQEAEIRWITVQKAALANSLRDSISNKPSQKRADGVGQGIGQT
jgi:hypothetical protein